MLDHDGRRENLRVGECIGDDLEPEVEVGVGVADEDGRERLAGVEYGRDESVAVGESEAGVDEQRFRLAGDEHCRLVL